jgi:hypothetical protein
MAWVATPYAALYTAEPAGGAEIVTTPCSLMFVHYFLHASECDCGGTKKSNT